MKGNFDLVVFDLDGTLIDSMDAIMESINKTFSHFGLGPYDWDRDIVRFFGKPFEYWAETLLQEGGKYSESNVKETVKKMWDNYAVIGPEKAKLKEGAGKLLKALDERGVKMAVATNMISRHAKSFFEHFEMKKYFKEICTVDDVERGKPHPDQMDCILGTLKVDKDRVLMTGDSGSDLEFARNSGVKVALLDSPWNKELKPDYRVGKLEDILRIVR